MIVLCVIGVVLGVLLLWFALSRFEGVVQRRYGHRFFTVRAFLAAVVGLCCVLGGHSWWQLARDSDGDTLNGVLVMAIGGLIALSLVIRNVLRTGFIVGVSGSVLQASLFGVLGYFGVIVLAVGVAVTFVAFLLIGMTSTPVYVVNRW